jgi:hypothetical protein
MSDSERVVIRSSWLGIFAILAPAVLLLLTVQIVLGSPVGAVTVLAVLVSMAVSLRLLSYVELTAQGMGIHTFGTRLVPWQHIGSVEQVNRQGGNQLRIYNLAENRSRFLPAPRGAFGVGKAETAAARDLIEEWLLVYRGSPPPSAPRATPPYPTSGEAIDPYRPPADA